MITSEGSNRYLSAQEWFGVAVRCAGLVSFYVAISHFLYFIDMRLGLSDTFGAVEPSVPTGYLIYVAAYIVTGVFLLRTADSIVRFAYGRGDASEPGTVETDG